MILVLFLIASSFVYLSQAACDNQCSGHGFCGKNGVCQCYDNWGLGLSHDTGDCSDRICPFEFAWVDTPDKNGYFHKYAECAGRGICNRGSGECECFPGYEGKGCQRTTCPNECSGHGRCQYIQELPFGVTPFDYLQGLTAGNKALDYNEQNAYNDFAYYNWDKTKTRGCVCDPEWGDVDCSKRMCPYGTDVMDHRNDMTKPGRFQIQQLTFVANAPLGNSAPYGSVTGTGSSINDLSKVDGKTFALTFVSKLNETFTTIPIVFKPYHPNFHQFVLDVQNALLGLPNRVIDRVEVHGFVSAVNTVHLNVTFVGDHVQGPQNLLIPRTYTCGDGCTPKLDGLELRVGSEIVQEAKFLDTRASATEPTAHKITGLLAHDSAAYDQDFNSFECGRRGKCDYTSGVCQCFSGYTGLACNTISALV